MTAYDVRAKATAGRMLAPIANGGKGQVVTITTTTGGAFNEATDTTTGATTTTQTGSGVVENYSAHSIDGTVIQAGDIKLLLSPLNSAGAAITKPVADKSTVTLADGSAWAVKRVDPLSPAGVVVLFELQMRS